MNNTDKKINRITGLMLVEVINSNPNGDPDKDNDPRLRYNNIGEISPVSVKRKIRDLIEYKDGPFWKEISESLNLPDEGFDIIESSKRNLKEIKGMNTDEILDKYWDARVFGTTTLGKKDEGGSAIRSGVCQFGLGLSLNPVNVERLTTSKKAAVEENKEHGLAPMSYRIVSYGLYAIPFFINATAAAKSCCTNTDLKLLFKVLPYIYTETASYVRSQMNIRHIFTVEHNRARSSFNDFKIIEALTPNPIDKNYPANSIDDYDMDGLMESIQKLNGQLKGKATPVKDWIE